MEVIEFLITVDYVNLEDLRMTCRREPRALECPEEIISVPQRSTGSL